MSISNFIQYPSQPTICPVKICGITNLNDAQVCIEHGVNALGFLVGVDPKLSKRAIDLPQCKTILKEVPDNICRIALIVNQPKEQVQRIIEHIPLDLLQFHGDETSQFCNQFNFPYIKALRVQNPNELPTTMHHILQTGAQAVLLDKWHQTLYGGSGETIPEDWLAKQSLPAPYILAGGINLENVTTRLITLKPYAIDVSSGVELSPGVKCPIKISEFMEKVRHIPLHL